MKELFLCVFVALLPVMAVAQSVPAPPTATPNADELPQSGEIDNAYVLDVQIMTTSDIGPFTRFSIAVPGHKTPYWFYVRNDDNTRAAERGAIVGLLMGVAETYRTTSYDDDEYVSRQEHAGSTANFTYTTVQGRREITTASLNSTLQH